jgi:small redox-active disulfide protein 2
MKVQILGTGCPKCRQMEENARQAISHLGIECDVEKVTHLKEIMKYGVLMTPGLAINGKAVASGKVLPVDEIVSLLAGAEDS